MSVRVILQHGHDPDHLAAVKREMESLGSPTVRVFRLDDGRFFATEGVHRLTAAHCLGIIPEFCVFERECFEEQWDAVTKVDSSLDAGLDFDLTVGDMFKTCLALLHENQDELLPVLTFASVTFA